MKWIFDGTSEISDPETSWPQDEIHSSGEQYSKPFEFIHSLGSMIERVTLLQHANTSSKLKPLLDRYVDSFHQRPLPNRPQYLGEEPALPRRRLRQQTPSFEFSRDLHDLKISSDSEIGLLSLKTSFSDLPITPIRTYFSSETISRNLRSVISRLTIYSYSTLDSLSRNDINSLLILNLYSKPPYTATT